MKKLTIGHLYPDLLNLYGDRGNYHSGHCNLTEYMTKRTF